MNLQDRLQRIASALPSDDSSVTLSRADILTLLGDEELDPCEPLHDLTVQQVADATGRAPSTVRGWLSSGALRAYKLNSRDWRVPQAALRAYLTEQACEPRGSSGDGEALDLSAWRTVGRP